MSADTVASIAPRKLGGKRRRRPGLDEPAEAGLLR